MTLPNARDTRALFVVAITIMVVLLSCHTRFMKANRMHLIYAPRSVYTHMIDYKAVIITSAKRKESIKDFITKPNK